MLTVADDVPVPEVLEAWSRTIVRELGGFTCSTFPAGRSSIACSCSRAAWSSTFHSHRRPSSARADRSSGCCSGRLSNSPTNRRPQHTNCSGTPLRQPAPRAVPRFPRRTRIGSPTRQGCRGPVSTQAGSSPRGDVVAFSDPEFPDHIFIQRVIGLPGERVEQLDGVVSIDGRTLDEPYTVDGRAGDGVWTEGRPSLRDGRQQTQLQRFAFRDGPDPADGCRGEDPLG